MSSLQKILAYTKIRKEVLNAEKKFNIFEFYIKKIIFQKKN